MSVGAGFTVKFSAAGGPGVISVTGHLHETSACRARLTFCCCCTNELFFIFALCVAGEDSDDEGDDDLGDGFEDFSGCVRCTLRSDARVAF